MQAGAATSQLQRGPNYLVKTLAVLSHVESERLKGGSRDPRWEGSSGALIRPSEETGNGRQKVGKGRRGKREEQKGEGGIYGRRESSEARTYAPSPIGRPLNLGGTTTEITEMGRNYIENI
jgi:hypothetical protein